MSHRFHNLYAQQRSGYFYSCLLLLCMLLLTYYFLQYPSLLLSWHFIWLTSWHWQIQEKKESLFRTWHLLNHLWIYVCHSFSKNTSCEILVLLSVLSFLSHDRNQSNFVISCVSVFPTMKNSYLFWDFLLLNNWVMTLINWFH